ncbi:MAG: lipid A biosynthesis acyltransferase [Pseudomonadota bacterium]
MKKIRYFLESILLALVLGLSKILGPIYASNVGGWIGKTIGPRLAASRKAQKNLNYIYSDLSDDEIAEITQNMWENLGRVMMEYPHLKTITKKYTTVKGVENLPQSNKPVILFAAHLGNWEVMPPSLFYHGKFSPQSVYRAPNNPFSDYLLKKARQCDPSLQTIPKSKSGMREMIKLLNQGGNLGVLIDQKYNEGIEINFLGKPAMTSDVFAQLVKKYNCPLIPVRSRRINGCSFEVEVFKPLDTNNLSVFEIVEKSHDYLQEWIDEAPSQWLWLHKRWNV